MLKESAPSKRYLASAGLRRRSPGIALTHRRHRYLLLLGDARLGAAPPSAAAAHAAFAAACGVGTRLHPSYSMSPAQLAAALQTLQLEELLHPMTTMKAAGAAAEATVATVATARYRA